jgi:hypothetical protein
VENPTMSIQQTNSRQFKFRQPLCGAFIIFGFVSFIPLLGAFLSGNGFRLTCQRAKLYEGTCEIAIGSFFKRERVSFELSALSMSKTEKSSSRDSESGEYCHLPTVVVKQDASLRVFTMIPGICSELEANRVVREINYFISTPTEDQLDIHRGSWKEVLLYSSPFLLMGLLMSALVARDSFSVCIFDLDRNCFTITRKRWFRTTNIEEFPLSAIELIDLETQDNGMSIEHKVIIKLNSGKEIALPHGNCSNQKLVSDLRQFLNFG